MTTNVVMSRSRWNGALHCVKKKKKKGKRRRIAIRLIGEREREEHKYDKSTNSNSKELGKLNTQGIKATCFY